MTDHFTYLLLGIGGGSVIAALAIGVVITHRASNVINLGHAAIGMYVAFAYYELRRSGELVLPILGLPGRVRLVDQPTVATALIISLLVAAAVGAAVFLLIFRPLRSAPPLARVVASLGLMVYLIGVVDLRFEGPSATSLRLVGPLSPRLVDVLGLRVPADRYLMALGTLGVIAILWAVDRWTRFGLATRAAAENERGAVLLGLSPTTIGLVNWILAAVLAGLALIAAAPLAGLDPGGTSLLIVPALGAALVGAFRSIVVAGLAGLAIGMAQSEILNLQASSEWLPDVGLQQGIPFLIVVVALVLLGRRLPDRATVVSTRLPMAPEPRRTMAVTAVVVGLGVVGLLVLDSSYRSGIIVSAIATIVALSVIVLTGLVGQISLATFALAGTAGFSMVRVGASLGWGFPLAPMVGIAVAVGVGLLAGLPAVRVRGLTLAVTTLAASIAIEQLLFRWSWFTGADEGARVSEPSLFGINLGISAPGDAYPRVAFGILTLVAMLGAMAMVVNLRQGATGRRWLAVRANERAAEAAGIPVAQVKLGATAVAAALAGLAGVLLAYEQQVVSGSSYGALASLVAVAIAYLAGIAIPAAALVAGVLASGGLLTVVLDVINEGSSKYQFAVNGLLLMVVAVRFPAGLVGAARKRKS
ncbi:MAG: ABC transporter permease [Acidimicrobiia bacterium]|nr:ABC transporter permease [Acidimicrobiia bacterium]